jgi:hypothetical protein
LNVEATIAEILRAGTEGLRLDEIEAGLARRQAWAAPGVAECLLLLSDHFATQGARWFRRPTSKSDAVLEALHRYARDTGRRLFKAEVALRQLSAEQQPTREELARIVIETGQFELLKNDMIRRKE